LKKIFKYTLLFLVFNFINFVSADEKANIINKLNVTNTLKFNFKQKTNQVNESGVCYLVFPKNLKCNYNDKNQKELIINKNRLAITQKRYNKTSYYSVKNSPFIKILDKKNLVKIIEKSYMEKEKKQIQLTSTDINENKIIVFFDGKSFDLMGWKIKDQFNNEITFLIEILSINEEIKLNFFKIPY
tara:strand:+ start:575 stop:1132 length:558 start_codon:yes stop_codon:yes gene_type:complete